MENISVDDNGDNPFNDMVLYDIVTQVRYICDKKKWKDPLINF